MSRKQSALNKFVTLPTEAIGKYREDAFHSGTLAALDIVFLHGQDTIASEIVNATNRKALLAYAKREDYYNLPNLRRIVRELKLR